MLQREVGLCCIESNPRSIQDLKPPMDEDQYPKNEGLSPPRLPHALSCSQSVVKVRCSLVRGGA